MSKKNILEQIKQLPSTPGVYIFKDTQGTVLYIGKATSLKDRVRSYFKEKKNYQRPIEYVIEKIEKIEIKETQTVLEAFLLEQELIKNFQPRYNILAKDDKSFVFLLLIKEDFPRWVILRKTDFAKEDLSKYKKVFGPYTSARELEIALKIMRKIFPYHSGRQKTEKGCLDYQLGLCPGPYAGAISKEEYGKNIQNIELMLKGKKKQLLGKLEKEMRFWAKNEAFEKAVKTRNQIFLLRHIQDMTLLGEKKFDVSDIMRIEGYDISNIAGQYMVGAMVVFDNLTQALGANKKEYRKFKIKAQEEIDDVRAMREILLRRFAHTWQRPQVILIDGGKGHLNMAKRTLEEMKIQIPIVAMAKGLARKKTEIFSYGKLPKLTQKILIQVRDEAHRFAITYHRKLRGTDFLKTIKPKNKKIKRPI